MKFFRAVLFLVTSSIACAGAPAPVDLLLVAADDATLQPVIQRLEQSYTETHAAWTMWLGKLEGKTVALTRTEGDPLNAVAATTLAIHFHPPRLILCYGVARPHDPMLHEGDVVASARFAAFDGTVSPVTALDGGSDPLKWRILPHALMTPGEKEVYTASFPSDAGATALALGLRATHGRVLRGVLGSAGEVNREADRIAWLHANWSTSTEDGESAHVAGCAELLGVPVVGLRVVDGTPTEAAEFALRFVEAWK